MSSLCTIYIIYKHIDGVLFEEVCRRFWKSPNITETLFNNFNVMLFHL